MADYQKMYVMLFNEISELIEDCDEMKAHLIKLQQQCEEIYISAEEEN